jgi:hypothetical protein
MKNTLKVQKPNAGPYRYDEEWATDFGSAAMDLSVAVISPEDGIRGGFAGALTGT